jgi:hypothetical protein
MSESTACTVCSHPKLADINTDLLNNVLTLSALAKKYNVGRMAMTRHRDAHLPRALARASEEKRTELADHLIDEINQCSKRVNLLFDACDRWLRDADDPSRYDIGPRADDVTVTYYEPVEEGKKHGKPRKAKMSKLLNMIGGAGYQVEGWEIRQADPRELILKTATRLEGQTELLARLAGEIKSGSTVNILVNPQWIELRSIILNELEAWPEARIKLAEALSKAGAEDEIINAEYQLRT